MMPLRRARPLLGTIVEIAVGGPVDAVTAGRAIDAAFAAVADVHARMSFHDADSEVARINRAGPGVLVEVSAQTTRVLRTALHLSELSDGLFDVCVAPILCRAGFLPAHPGITRRDGDWRDIDILDDRRVRLGRAVAIDLGGIAKGFAADRAIGELRNHGVTAATVNAGGDLRRIGPGTGALHVRRPDDPTSVIAVNGWTDAAATTAGYYHTDHGAQSPTPIADPRQRKCVPMARSVTVLADICMVADALTKLVQLDAAVAAPILERFDARAIVLEADAATRQCLIYDSAAAIDNHREAAHA